MASHPKSVLVRICDFLASPYLSVGTLLGLAPSHHIVMENILYGQKATQDDGGPKSEQWDLKPMDYFYPERDVAAGWLSSEATKSRRADKFDGKIKLTQHQADEFKQILVEDTRLLGYANAVDYSLFIMEMVEMSTVKSSACTAS